MLIIPYSIETLFERMPVANWLIIAGCTIIFILTGCDFFSTETIHNLVLGGGSWAGLPGHLFLHGGIMHLVGNMLFLWVFGNAICANTNNLVYPALYLAVGFFAAAIHLLMDGHPAIGASGAINGVIGIAFAMYPVNRVHVWCYFLIRAWFFSCPLWVLTIIWFFFDLYGAIHGKASIAYWAHVGGLLSGIAIGLVALRMRWVTLTIDDNRSLFEIFTGKELERKRP